MDTIRLYIVQFFFLLILITGWEKVYGQNINTQPYRFKSISVNDNLSLLIN